MKMNPIVFVILCCLLLGNSVCLGTEPAVSSDPSYILTERQPGVKHPSLSLNGQWKFRYSPQSKWSTITVPGEAAMQGYAVEHDKPVLYKKEISVPADYAGRRIILRFDGVYSHARLMVNGRFVREHHGGFTRWETDVTSCIKPGKRNEIRLEVTDRLDEISYASGYAHHPVGGILRDVTLFALPETHLYDVRIETLLDTAYTDATLRFACHSVVSGDAAVRFRLIDPSGKPVPLAGDSFPLTAGQHEQVWDLPVSSPEKWDAEHPNLYTLTVTVMQNGKEQSRFTKKIGFRQIEIKGDKLLVNGRPVKLRGACRHDLHPVLGRATTAETDSLDVRLFKEANMNFVRTSHYPPTERFLEYCDRYGLYVECETAVCFVNTHRQKNYAPAATHDDPDYTGRYLSQCREMVKSFRFHPAVLFWSIGNESTYGANFRKCYDWVKATDTTRPVIFSYPGSQKKEDAKIYDILSMHYQDVHGNLDQWGLSVRNFQGYGLPVLFDEWAHPACYTYSTLQHDPNIREFWGQSLDRMWSGLFDSPGGLGGAIWGYVDEVFMLPEPKAGTAYWKEFARTAKPAGYQGNCVGYGEWGIVDIWRRKKPEFWSTRKAYSPIRVQTARVREFTPGMPIRLPVYNRFDHTCLDEVQAVYLYKGVKKTVSLPALPPHRKGILTLPADKWENGEHLLLEFYTATGDTIDTYRIGLGEEKINYPEPLAAGKLQVKETESALMIRGEGFEIPFDKTSGLITGAKAGDKVVITSGPFLNVHINYNHLTGAEVRKTAPYFEVADTAWRKNAWEWYRQNGDVYVRLSGTYGEVAVEYSIKVSAGGQLSVNYHTAGLPNGFVRETGLAFHLADSFETVTWKRNGYWDYYPEESFAGNEGCAPLYNTYHPAYGERPAQPWHTDTHNYYYWADAGADVPAPLTQQAKGTKEHIYYYTLAGGRHLLSVLSRDASVACRLNKRASGQLVLYTNNRWDYPEIAWGNYCKKLEALPCFGEIRIMLK